jgi:small-conductance mechanosensitive channel
MTPEPCRRSHGTKAPLAGPAGGPGVLRSVALFLLPLFPAGLLLLSLFAAAQAPSRSSAEQAVLDYLNQTIAWYHSVPSAGTIAREPEEAVLLNQLRQTGEQIAARSFQYARAEADVLSTGAKTGGTAAGSGLDLQQKLTQAESDIQKAQATIDALKAREATAGGATQRRLVSQIAAAQAMLELTQTRSEVLRGVLQFQVGTGAGSSLRSQIEQIARSAPEINSGQPAPGEQSAATAAAAGTSSGTGTATGAGAFPIHPGPSSLTGLAADLLSLTSELRGIAADEKLTTQLIAASDQRRKVLVQDLSDLLHRVDALDRQMGNGSGAGVPAKAGRIAAATSARPRAASAGVSPGPSPETLPELTAIIARFKRESAALVPLGQQSALLHRYSSDLAAWDSIVDRESADESRGLFFRLAVVLMALGLVAIGARMWRRVVFRYVHDVRRRYHLLMARRLVVALVVIFVLLFAFAAQLGSFATVMGLATAGIAVALQNVILSVAAYFLLIGRFGVRVGDFVQINNVLGQVVDIGPVKLRLMEVTNLHNREPTGRMVVFTNSVLFQPTGNFFKQVPGTNFVWNEVSLLLAPQTDYGLAEKRLLEAVNKVFSEYRESLEGEYLTMAEVLNVEVVHPRPHVRLRLSEQGLQLLIRYPAPAWNAAEIADRATREIFDAIRREPTLTLVGQATPNIQPAPQNPPQAA